MEIESDAHFQTKMVKSNQMCAHKHIFPTRYDFLLESGNVADMNIFGFSCEIQKITPTTITTDAAQKKRSSRQKLVLITLTKTISNH